MANYRLSLVVKVPLWLIFIKKTYYPAFYLSETLHHCMSTLIPCDSLMYQKVRAKHPSIVTPFKRINLTIQPNLLAVTANLDQRSISHLLACCGARLAYINDIIISCHRRPGLFLTSGVSALSSTQNRGPRPQRCPRCPQQAAQSQALVVRLATSRLHVRRCQVPCLRSP